MKSRGFHIQDNNFGSDLWTDGKIEILDYDGWSGKTNSMYAVYSFNDLYRSTTLVCIKCGKVTQSYNLKQHFSRIDSIITMKTKEYENLQLAKDIRYGK